MKLLRCLPLALAPLVAFAAGEKIAVIPKGTTHSFWKSVESGAQQIAVVQQFVSSGVNAIVLAPLDDTALRGPVKSAAERNIPVVIFDSALKGEPGKDFLSYVATNNTRGGEIGGEELARLLGGKGKVVLLRYAEGSASTGEREAGFMSVMKKHPGITVIVDNRYAGPTISSAQDASMNLIDKVREADGIFCPNESSTQGMILALRQTGLAGKKKFVGFDTSAFLLGALAKGDVQGLVAQNPVRMGYLGVVTAVKHLRGEKVETVVDTGCVLVTKENRHTPEVEAVIGK
jgi:ribose transport system substrate-binding protein